jgi:hypothetical protein
MDTEYDAFCRRWQIGQPAPAMIFDHAGRRDTDGLPIALINLSSRISRRVWSAAVIKPPASTWTLVLSDQRPWALGAALTRCAIALAADGAIDVIAYSGDAIDEVVVTLSGLSWLAISLGNPEPDVSSRARSLCASVLTRFDIDRSDPSDLAHHQSIKEILTTIGVGGRA